MKLPVTYLLTFRENKEVHAIDSEWSELIRCKDCKHAHMTAPVFGREPECKYCDIWFPNEEVYLEGNYYCASAERKEE